MTDYATRAAEERLTRDEAAEYLRVCEKTVRNLINAGELDEIRIGGRSQIPIDTIHDYLARQRTNAVGKHQPLRSVV